MEKTYRVLKLLILVLLMAVLILGAYVLYGKLSPQVQIQTQLPAEETADAGQEERKPAPDFSFYDLEGNAYALSDFRNTPVILNFWASWCGPCKNEMPHFQTAFDTYGGEIQFLLVNLTDGTQDTKEKASSYIDGQGYTFPVYYDTDMAGARAYGIYAVPVTCFIDGEGNLVSQTVGMLTKDALQQGIDSLLTGRAPSEN